MQDKVPPTSSALSDVQPECCSLEVYNVKTAKVKLTSSCPVRVQALSNKTGSYMNIKVQLEI